MSDVLTYLKESPWEGLGATLDVAPTNAQELVEKTKLNWTVSAHNISTDLEQPVRGYSVIYRDDTNVNLGLVKTRNPRPVQNIHMFDSIQSLFESKITFETDGAFDEGRTVFGCFKIADSYKVLDDNIDHYFVVVNDHLKPDGKVTILNTPIRVVCRNTLAAALTNNSGKIRVPIVAEKEMNESIVAKVLESATASVSSLGANAEKMATTKIEKSDIAKLEDIYFPFQYVDNQVADTRANASAQAKRDAFNQCLNVDNLQNYVGTLWQVFNALTDFEQHYYTNVDKTLDLKYRMNKIGVGTPTETSLVSQFMKQYKKQAIAA